MELAHGRVIAGEAGQEQQVAACACAPNHKHASDINVNSFHAFQRACVLAALHAVWRGCRRSLLYIMPARLSVRTGDHVALRGREAPQFDVVGVVRESIPGARIVAEVFRVALHKAARQSASNGWEWRHTSRARRWMCHATAKWTVAVETVRDSDHQLVFVQNIWPPWGKRWRDTVLYMS